MDFFNLKEYRKIIKNRLLQYPKKGYGVLKQIADHLRVNSTFISQVVNGAKDFNLEQASLLCEFFGFTDLETKYFLLLIQLERAGNETLKKFLRKEIEQVRKESEKLSTRLPAKEILSESDKGIFYSQWYYSAIRQISHLPGSHTAESIATDLRLPRKMVSSAIDFLLRTGLCIEEKGKIKLGQRSTHLGPESPFVKMHHTHWRAKAMDLFEQEDSFRLHYSSPMTLLEKDVAKIRLMLVECIENIGKTVDSSEPEAFYCINMDWFKVR